MAVHIICLSVCLSIYPPICLSVRLSACSFYRFGSIFQKVFRGKVSIKYIVYMYVFCLYVYLSFILFVCEIVCLSVLSV